MRAHVLETGFHRSDDLVVHRRRNADAAGVRQTLKPSRNIDAVAVDVIAVDDHLAEIEADSKLKPALLGQRIVALPQFALNGDGSLESGDHAAEIRQDRVSRVMHDAPAAAFDLHRHEVEIVAENSVGARLVLPHQPAIAGDVGVEDRGQFAF